ncbi:hypothetical protein [Anabaena azotica]|nr:hypothetical protein [Anabaena azotica]
MTGDSCYSPPSPSSPSSPPSPPSLTGVGFLLVFQKPWFGV